MSINAKMVSELRDKTNATMNVCKRALVRTNGDMSAAEEEIRVNYKAFVVNSELEQLRQRVQELEKERDEYHQVAMQTSEDSKRLDFLDQTAAEYILSVGRLWYSRKGYNQPYIKRENLRDAIDHGILAKGYKK